MLTPVVLMLMLAASEPATSGASPPPAKTAAQLDNEKVCVNVIPTGSNIGQRVCKTRKAWRKLEEAQRRKAQESMDPSSQARAKE
jgi:hypothetical protein